MEAPMSCPSSIHWLSHSQPDCQSDEDRDHLRVCPACAARADAIAPLASFEFELPASPPWDVDLGSTPLLEEQFVVSSQSPARGEVWLSAPSFHINTQPAIYENLDRMMFVVIDADIRKAGTQWVDVAPIWGDVELASDADVLIEPEHSTLDRPLRFQPQRQLLMAYQQLERKVGEIVQDAFGELLDSIRGTIDASWRGTPYDGPYDPRIEPDRWIGELIERLREPYAVAMAQATDTIASTVADRRSDALADVIALNRKLEVISDSHQFALAAQHGGRPQVLHLYDDCERVDVFVRIDMLSDAVSVIVKNLLDGWIQNVDLLLELREGHKVSVENLDIGEYDAGLANASTLKDIHGAFLRPAEQSRAR
jgi:hypothetical protein